MTVVEESFYDDEEDTSTNVGDGNLTRTKKYTSASASRDVDFAYDWRNRRTTADGEEQFFEKLDYDNQDRVTARYRYQASESSSNLRSKEETKYDSRGEVYEDSSSTRSIQPTAPLTTPSPPNSGTTAGGT